MYGAESRFCSVDGATLVLEQPADDLVGTIVADRYHILERIGVGGMGQVFLAEHVRMKRKSALKIMREALTTDPIAVSRFHREAENASQINHPNVAAVYDFGETSAGLVYIAMEYVPGEPMSQVLNEEGALNPARVADIIAQAADALSAAHSLGILHRDLKPDNIMLTTTRWGTDLVKLVDFGISRAMASATQQFTSTGMIVGTPDYMSPEQLTGDALDSRSDQYALALIAYYALTGVFPFLQGGSKDALLTRLTNTPRTLAEAKPDVDWPPSLQTTFDRALALDVNERYAEVHEFGRDFDAAIGEMTGTDTMEHYREALRQRFTTPRGGPSVTPPRAVPSLQITPVRPMPSLERAAAGPPLAEATADAPAPEATVDEPASQATDAIAEPGAPSIGSAPGHRRPFSWRVYAVAAAVGLVAIAVWQLAGGREQSPPPATVNADSGAVPNVPSPQPVATASALAPSLGLDSSAALVRGSVFAVLGDAQQGSAFLVDSSGIVLTSAEFVRDGAEPRIQLDAERLVRGRVMAVDAPRGVAAVRIPIQHCRRCQTLSLNTDTTARLAVGDSLVVPSAVTRGTSSVDARGAVTQVDGRTVQTSLRLSASGSGAPVVAAQRGVVALAIRRGRQTTVVPAEALASLRAAAFRRRTEVLPNDTLVPTWPSVPVRSSVIAAARSRPDPQLDQYKITQEGFELLVMTPQVMAWRDEQVKQKIAAAQVMVIGDSQPRLVDPIQRWRGWDAYLSERRAVVVLNASPDAAGYDKLSARSAIGDLRRGDLSDLRLMRGDTLVRPIEAARMPAVVNPEAYQNRNLPVFTSGVAVYHPREFARRANRTFPRITVELYDARMRRMVQIALTEATLQAIERDLGSYQR